MKKYYLLLSLIALLVSSCEKDDFCIEPITPNMVIRFYNATNITQTKPVEDLSVNPEGFDELYSNANLDSILIPLDVTSNQIIYNLSSESNIDIITINYDVEEVFVSRSCGFKAIFNNVSVTSDVSNDWIIGLTETLENTITIPTIDNETAAHVKIFH
ncbi:DUF6452 family protein [Flavobacteriaceae bacterium]|jgi:hypothetical protein|nr:DUF6452 family protein [Flavobacteriaceae bacterium]MDB2417931.1 DUF6452 family protein [Flavobacteriaceae bacterium]MDB2674563.1 DUF6452 family protein [Flavobacteriaceae bacterium]MDG1161709.1 DUF6452 family protein [Flavobacteriaceae bacterium]|tara:strand:+ start:3424 stop:3897 length:474 start_codon:yes stop_codon:yes gene_type:complete